MILAWDCPFKQWFRLQYQYSDLIYKIIQNRLKTTLVVLSGLRIEINTIIIFRSLVKIPYCGIWQIGI